MRVLQENSSMPPGEGTSVPQYEYVNVGEIERLLSGLAGGGLVYLGIKKGSWAGAALALLGGAFLYYRAISGHCPAYEAIGANKDRKIGLSLPLNRAIHVEKAITIGAPPEPIFAFWRQFDNLPKFMEHLEDVQVNSDVRSHWIARGPAGMRVEWDAVISNEEPGQFIEWQSCAGADVENSGRVSFISAPAGKGTEIRLVLNYKPPAGALGAITAKILGDDPGLQIESDLRRLKQFLETGEIATIEGQSQGQSRRAPKRLESNGAQEPDGGESRRNPSSQPLLQDSNATS